MEYFDGKDFLASMNKLKGRGGPYTKAVEKVLALRQSKQLFKEPDPLSQLPTTKHGETRIKKCVKYDLPGFCRLITIRDNGAVMFCFAGDHDDADIWLNKNRGMTLVRDKLGQVDYVYGEEVSTRNPELIDSSLVLTDGKLYTFIQPEKYFDDLVDTLPRSTVRKLEDVESITSESDIYEITKGIDDFKLAETVHNVFTLLKQNKREEALQRIKLHFGELEAVEQLSEEEVKKLADSQNIKKVKSDDPYYQQVFEYFVKNAAYMDWMLFLHPDQQKLVEQDFNGPAKLLGVSGSGKTCIVVHRAIRLAKMYQGEKILVLTLNRQLAKLISQMVDASCLPEYRDYIDVKPFFSLCQELLDKFEPENSKLYDDVTWKSLEHIDEVWREYYRCEVNNEAAAVLSPVHDSLISRGVNAEKYIREEFDWIRSAVSIGKRKEYLTIDRAGRNYPLDKKFRRIVLEGLEHWEQKMQDVGITDYLGLSTALYKYLNKIKPQYRSIIVDESQDFGTVEYRLIKQLVIDNENDLFLCGDAAQQVLTKHRVFSQAGIVVAGARSHKINKNYRNSREILNAANSVLMNHLSEELIESGDFEILDPEFANFSADPPLVLSATDLEMEIAYALNMAESEISDNNDSKVCIAICGFSLYQIKKFGERIGITVLDGEKDIGTGNIFLSDLEHTKGFEFDSVVIVNCNDSVIPDLTKPEKEQYRDLAKLYVAMTRAKRQLVVSFSSRKSLFLKGADEWFFEATWDEYIDTALVKSKGVPDTLETIRAGEYTDHSVDIFELNGSDFLYQSEAIGLPLTLVEKIRTLIDGKGVIRNGNRVKWRSLKTAAKDIESSPASRQAFGPANVERFRELISKLEANKE